jgi:hypothetical protein
MKKSNGNVIYISKENSFEINTSREKIKPIESNAEEVIQFSFECPCCKTNYRFEIKKNDE